MNNIGQFGEGSISESRCFIMRKLQRMFTAFSVSVFVFGKQRKCGAHCSVNSASEREGGKITVLKQCSNETVFSREKNYYRNLCRTHWEPAIVNKCPIFLVFFFLFFPQIFRVFFFLILRYISSSKIFFKSPS